MEEYGPSPDNIYAWLYLLAALPQLMYLSWAYSRCFRLKVRMWQCWLIIDCISLAFLIPQTMFGVTIPGKTLIYFALYFIAMRLMSENAILKMLLYYAIDVVMMLLLELLCYWFFGAVSGGEFLLGGDRYDFMRLLATVVMDVLIMPIEYLYSSVWNARVNKHYDGNGRLNPGLLIFPLSQIIMVVGLVIERSPLLRQMNGIDPSLLLAAAFIVFIASDVVYTYIVSAIEKKRLIENELNSLKYAYELEEQHFCEVEEKRLEVAKIRHDINNQLYAIKQLISDGEFSEARDIINELEDRLAQTKEYRYCSIPVVNAIVTEKCAEAQKYGIRIDTAISIDDTQNITRNHICSVFANLLDNAISAEKGFEDSQSDKKVITVTAVRDRLNIYITVKNYVPKEHTALKLNMATHGYGQQILRDIAKIYSGSFTVSHNGDEYTGTIVLRMQEVEATEL